MKVKSYNSKSSEDLRQFLIENSVEDFNPTLAIFFCDAQLDIPSLQIVLQEFKIDAIGTTTCGEIFDNKVKESSCSIILMELDRKAYEIIIEPFTEGEFETSKKVATIAKQKFENPAIITYASKIGVNGDSIVNGFKEILDSKIPIFGGLAGDNHRNEIFTVFHNSKSENEGLVTLIINNDIVKVEGESYSGWTPLGKTHVVTKAIGNVLFEIDHLPALDLFIEYFGIEKSYSVNGESLEQIPGMYSIKVINEDNLEYMRSPLQYDNENHSLILGGEVQNGDKIKFCPIPDLEIVEETVDFFKSYSKLNSKVDALIINSCAGRKMAFGPMMSKEINEIYNIWKVPTVGFLALGEIGRNANENECSFHNVTCSLLTLTKV